MSLEDRLRALIAKKKVVLLGIGNPDRGDDGVGPAVIEKVRESERLISINGEDVPENYTGMIRAAQPEVILCIDAVDFGGQAGDTVLVQTESLTQPQRFSSHHASLALVMNYLRQETGAEVWLLGVQPQSTRIGEPKSPEIDLIIQQLAEMLRKIADEDRS